MMSYTVTYFYTLDNDYVSKSSRSISFDDNKDHREEIKSQMKEEFKTDPNFKVDIFSSSNNSIDYELTDRMRATREICELGHRVRAEAKLKNRQPLKSAYVLFSDQNLQDWMIYVDCNHNFYSNTIGEELNVDNVVFIGEKDRFVDVILKPNFKVLGPKGFGKQAQVLKNDLNKMDQAKKNELHLKLVNGAKEVVSGIELSLEDVEVEYKAKSGFASSFSKTGMIILDTTLTPGLIERCFVSEFRSTIQNLRKEVKLNLTDKISMDIVCDVDKARVLVPRLRELEKALLATEIRFIPTPVSGIDKTKVHQLSVDGTEMIVWLYREIAQ